jgi:NhaC family Na+:H+ antiporter
MLITTIPSLLISILVFTIAGLSASTTSSADMMAIEEGLQSTFNISPWLLIVPILTGILIAKRLPAIVTLFASAFMAAIAMVIAQPELILQIANVENSSALSSLKAIIIASTTNNSIETGNELLNNLVTTRGMGGMMGTIWLIICAMCFGGVMYGSGMLSAITQIFLRVARRTVSVVSSTVGSGLFFNLVTGDQYISIILTGNLFRKLYDERDLEHRLLSRSIEDSATITSVLIPWNSCGMTQSTVLGVATLTYMPYCVFNIISPLMSIFMATIGYKIYKRSDNAQ